MANTGKKIVITLKEVYVVGGAPTGNTKANTVGDPDYIAPYTDTVACPVVNTLACPVIIGSGTPGLAGSLEYEFTLLDSVATNANVAKIKLYFKKAGVTQATLVILNNVVGKRYWSGSQTGLAAGTYTIDVEYLNGADVVQATCANTQNSTITVT